MTIGPTCTVLAGTNGSGKSSLYEDLGPSGEFVNADVIAKRISPTNPEAVSLPAGKQVLHRLRQLINEGKDFVFETTLSGNQPLELMRKAKQRGYQVGLVFVVLASVELNVSRVAQRVAEGGHDIPEDVIRRRYDNSVVRLTEALRLADDAVIYDNTTRLPRALLRVREGVVIENQLSDKAPTHLLLAKALVDAFGV